MKRLTAIKPYNDNKLVWNEDTKRYELAFEYCKENFETENFGDDEILKKRIIKNSRVIYRFIHNRVNQNNRPVVEVLLSRTAEGRNFILELLSTQFESDVDSGYNDLTNIPAVNTANNQITPREEIKRNEVSVATENVWDDNSSYFGFNIGYQCIFPHQYFLLARGLK